MLFSRTVPLAALGLALLVFNKPADAQITQATTHVIPPKTAILDEDMYEHYLYGYYYGPSPYWYDEHYRMLYFPEYPPGIAPRVARRVAGQVPPRVPRRIQGSVTRPPSELSDYHDYYLNPNMRFRPALRYSYPSSDVSRLPAVRRYK